MEPTNTINFVKCVCYNGSVCDLPTLKKVCLTSVYITKSILPSYLFLLLMKNVNDEKIGNFFSAISCDMFNMF